MEICAPERGESSRSNTYVLVSIRLSLFPLDSPPPPSSPSLSLCALTKAGDTNAYACLGITHPPCNAFQTRGGQFKDTIQSIKHIIIYLQRAPAQSLLNYWLTLSPGIAGKSNISNIIFLTFSSFRPPRYILGGLLGRRLRVALR